MFKAIISRLRPRLGIFNLNDHGWGRKPDNSQGPQNSNNNDGPPDLDKVWQDFNKKLGGIFGGKKRGGGNNPRPGGDGGGDGGGPSNPGSQPGGRALGAIASVVFGVLALLWLASGFFILPEGQSAVILRFGEYKKMINQAGISWRMPYPIEQHLIVNVQELRQVEVGYRQDPNKNKQVKESLMLTNDQSIVDLQFAVQYRISEPDSWLFNNHPISRDPEVILRQIAETSMRTVVGRSDIDQVLYAEKDEVAKRALAEMQAVAQRYKLGVTIIDLRIQQAQPPAEVQAAFEDANKAAQDRERLINEGRAYANDVIPRARGTAGRLLQEAEGYRERVIATADGDAARFKGVLAEYSKAPQVTRERLYLESMQQVFSNASKVYVDSRNGSGQGSLLYLPLDKLMQQAGVAPAAETNNQPRGEPVVVRPEPSPPAPRNEENRVRDMRNR